MLFLFVWWWRLPAGAARGTRRAGGSVVVVCGPPATGKTRLFLRLVGKDTLASVSSAATNVGCMAHAPDGAVVIKDVPGSAKLRVELFDAAAGDARAIVLLLDGGPAAVSHSDMCFLAAIVAHALRRARPLLVVAACDSAKSNDAQRHLETALQRAVDKSLADSEAEESDSDARLRRDARTIVQKTGIDDAPGSFSLAALSAVLSIDFCPAEEVAGWILKNR